MFNQSQCSRCINDDNKDNHKEQTITIIMTSSYIFCNAELGDMRFHLNIRSLQRYIFSNRTSSIYCEAEISVLSFYPIGAAFCQVLQQCHQHPWFRGWRAGERMRNIHISRPPLEPEVRQSCFNKQQWSQYPLSPVLCNKMNIRFKWNSFFKTVRCQISLTQSYIRH